MNRKSSVPTAAFFAASVFSSAQLLGDEKKNEPAKSVEEQISQAVKEAMPGAEVKSTVRVESKAYVIDADGKKQELEAGQDLEAMIEEALKILEGRKREGKGEDEVEVRGSKTIVIEADGTTRALKDSEKIADVVKEALEGLNLKDLDLDSVTQIGPIVWSSDQSVSVDRKEIEELKQELAEHRKLLEKILEKLK